MQAYLDRLTDSKATQFADKVGDLFKTLPKLPSGFTEFLVKVAPYLALLSAILSLIGGPLLSILGTFASILTLSPMFMVWTIVTVALMVAQAILLLMAFQPLQARDMKGWMYLFWAEVIGVIQMLVNLIGNQPGSIIISLLITALWFYVLFQMRTYYGKGAVKPIA